MYREYISYHKEDACLKMSTSEEVPDLTNCLKQLLERKDEFHVIQDTGLSEDDVSVLLQDSEDVCDADLRAGICGYPTYPLYRELGHLLESWMKMKRCPIEDLLHFFMLNEDGYAEKRADMIAGVTPLLESLQSLWELWSSDERMFKVKEVIQKLGKRGLLDLLGIRRTVGSIDAWPAPRQVLEQTFKKPNKPDTASMLSVGARALSKHCHRDQTTSWWGDCTGTELAKNEHASTKMAEVLDEAQWINIHGLPQNLPILEVRQKDGYGMRWSPDGLQFRGFLEPQMVDGHDVGWRH